MQFQQDWPKDKNYRFLNFSHENLEKFRSSELNDAPPEGSTGEADETSLVQDCNFVNVIFWPENRKFCSTELYNAPLEGSTIFLYRSYLGHMLFGKLSIS